MKTAKKILIVDDEPNVRLVFRTALESSDTMIATAEEGATALRWLRESPADLVLLDLKMPGISGMEVLETLRSEGNDVPVAIVTAHGDVPNAVHAMKLGAVDFLSKPITPEALRKMVAEVLQRHEAGKPEPSRHPPNEPVTVASEFADNLARAKRALNYRAFDEADIFLKQAVALDPNSAEVHNLLGVLHELRDEHDASYREYRAAIKADRHHEAARHNMQRYYERFTFGRSDLPLDLGGEKDR